jgi:hypothetical protein
MVTNEHLDKLASWWAVRLPHVSLGFRAEFKEHLLHQLRKQEGTIILSTHDVLSRPIMEAVLYTSVVSDVTLSVFIRELVESNLWSKVCEDMILVEENPLVFSSSPRLLLHDGSTSNYCVHCMKPVGDDVDYCQECETGMAVCLACRKQRAIPNIGLDGVCEDCMQVEISNQIYELGVEHERQQLSYQEEW